MSAELGNPKRPTESHRRRLLGVARALRLIERHTDDALSDNHVTSSSLTHDSQFEALRELSDGKILSDDDLEQLRHFALNLLRDTTAVQVERAGRLQATNEHEKAGALKLALIDSSETVFADSEPLGNKRSSDGEKASSRKYSKKRHRERERNYEDLYEWEPSWTQKLDKRISELRDQLAKSWRPFCIKVWDWIRENRMAAGMIAGSSLFVISIPILWRSVSNSAKPTNIRQTPVAATNAAEREDSDAAIPKAAFLNRWGAAEQLIRKGEIDAAFLELESLAQESNELPSELRGVEHVKVAIYLAKGGDAWKLAGGELLESADVQSASWRFAFATWLIFAEGPSRNLTLEVFSQDSMVRDEHLFRVKAWLQARNTEWRYALRILSEIDTDESTPAEVGDYLYRATALVHQGGSKAQALADLERMRTALRAITEASDDAEISLPEKLVAELCSAQLLSAADMLTSRLQSAAQP